MRISTCALYSGLRALASNIDNIVKVCICGSLFQATLVLEENCYRLLCLSFQVSKAAWQEKRFQDYNERCTFHHHARVRLPPSFADADSVVLVLVSRMVSVVSQCISSEAEK